MSHRRCLGAFALALSFVSFLPTAHAADRVGPGVPEFWVRPGYKVTLAAENVGPEVRFLEVDQAGRLFISIPREQKIVVCTDADRDGVFETKADFVTGKDAVHGMHVVGDWLWYGMSGQICKARIGTDGKASDDQVVIRGLPEGGGHWWRAVCVTDDAIYTSIGDSQNIGPEEALNTERQKIWRFNLDGSNKTLFSSGVRNTEKLRLRPGTKELWGADHGSDNFGGPYGEKTVRQNGLSNQAITDKMPPEEFNHYVEGGFYGHPWIVGDRVPRLEYREQPDIALLAARTITPAYKGGAHWANNGFTFTTQDTFGDSKGDAFIAYHGSWNSSQRVGYQVHRVFFDKETGKPYGGQPVVICLGGNDQQRVLGRPCDVVEAADGTLLFSDTQTRKVYRISKE